MMFDERTQLCLHWCYARLSAVLKLRTSAAVVPVQPWSYQGVFRSGAAARQRMEISAITILLLVLCATVLSLPGVRKLRPGILLARGVPRKRPMTNVNTRTPRAELKRSMRVGRRPANLLYPAEMSDRINVLQPQQTENQLAQSLNKVHCIKAIQRKRKWRWRCRHKQTAIEISALLFVTTCVLRPTVTYSEVSPLDATSYDCTNETRYESVTLQSVQLRPAIDNVDCWFDSCYMTEAPC